MFYKVIGTMSLNAFREWRLLAILAAAVVCMGAAAKPALAERPHSTQLLPVNTLAYVSIADVPTLKKSFSQTALGRIASDLQMKPLVDDLYAAAEQAFAPAEERLGLSLSRLLSIPQGEVAVAMVAIEDQPPAVVAIIDIPGQRAGVETLLERLTKALDDNGGRRHEETVLGIDVVLYELAGAQRQDVAFFIKEDTLVIGNRLVAVEDVLAAWEGVEFSRFSENPDFAAIRNACGDVEGVPPQISWFADPVSFLKTGQLGSGGQFVVAILPAIGLDGLFGVGGTFTFATESFDDVQQIHVLVNEPRFGVIEMLALDGGDFTPESWVPDDTLTYGTVYWDVAKTYFELAEMLDAFWGEGVMAAQVQSRLSSIADVDFERDILAALDGRFSFAQVIEPPATIGSAGTVFGIWLTNADDFRPVFEKFLDGLGTRVAPQDYGSMTYYAFGRPRRLPGGSPDQVQQLCVAMLGDDLVIADRPSLMKKAIVTHRTPSGSLAETIDYKLIASRVSRQPGGERPGFFSFNRPDVGMRWMYDMAQAKNTQDMLAKRAEDNPFFRGVNDAMRSHPLPPFSVIEKYLAPAGGFMTNDTSGFHYTTFTMKRDVE